MLDELEERFGYAFARSEFYRPIVEAMSSPEELASAKRDVRFVDQPHGGPTSLGLRFDEGGHSVAYAIDFSDLTDEMAALYEGADVWIADCLTRPPHPDTRASRRRARLGEGIARRPSCISFIWATASIIGSLIAELPDWAAPAYDGLEIA